MLSNDKSGYSNFYKNRKVLYQKRQQIVKEKDGYVVPLIWLLQLLQNQKRGDVTGSL